MRKLLIAIVALTVLIGIVTVPYSTQETLTVEVLEKERVMSNGDSSYLIFTNKEVFLNGDCYRLLKFNSSDVYGKIAVGKKYKVKVYGFRLPIFSWYRNIISVEEIKRKKQDIDVIALEDSIHLYQKDFIMESSHKKVILLEHTKI